MYELYFRVLCWAWPFFKQLPLRMTGNWVRIFSHMRGKELLLRI